MIRALKAGSSAVSSNMMLTGGGAATSASGSDVTPTASTVEVDTSDISDMMEAGFLRGYAGAVVDEAAVSSGAMVAAEEATVVEKWTPCENTIRFLSRSMTLWRDGTREPNTASYLLVPLFLLALGYDELAPVGISWPPGWEVTIALVRYELWTCGFLGDGGHPPVHIPHGYIDGCIQDVLMESLTFTGVSVSEYECREYRRQI